MSFGRLAVDWEERVNIGRMRRERLERAQKALKAHGSDVALLLKPDNQRYVANNPGTLRNERGALTLRCTLLPADGTPTLFEFGMWYPYVKDTNPEINVERIVPLWDAAPPLVHERQLQKFAKQIKEKMKGASLSIDTYNLPIFKALEKEGIKPTASAAKPLMEARTTKTGDEIECHRIAATLVESGWGKVKGDVRPGITENEIRGTFLNEVLRLGAQPIVNADIFSGPRTWINNDIPSDRIVRAGDLIVMHACSNTYNGYRTCYYRTFVCGRANQAQKDAYEKCRDYLYGAIKLLRPGASTKDIAEKWPKAEEFGYPDEDSALWVQWGHGIGLSGAEPPSITRLWSLDYPETLRAGMVLGMETWYPTKLTGDTSYPRGQSVRIEEMVLVTDTGYEVLSRWPIDEITECQF